MKATPDRIWKQVVDEAMRPRVGRQEFTEVLTWDEVTERQEQLYADELRARFHLGDDADTLAYEPLLARIMRHLPPENFVFPVDRYHHAGLIAMRVMETRKAAPRGWAQ